MVHFSLSFLIFLFAGSVSAAQLSCVGWRQNGSDPLQNVLMKMDKTSRVNPRLSVEIIESQYEVIWDTSLDTLYVSINYENKPVLFSMARVPNPKNNETFVDLNLPAGPRLSVSCRMK